MTTMVVSKLSGGAYLLEDSADATRSLHIAAGAADVEAQIAGFAAGCAPPPLPAEVPLYRVRIICKLQGLETDVLAFIATLPEPQKTIAGELWAGGDNLLVGGDFAQAFKAYKGFSDAAWAALIQAAINLTL